ncbi:MAG: hypothetical protein K0Q46_4657 [Rhodococcus erythropolis]|nr:hypothetical protein [Rhodococcus erythropolis]
MIESYEALGVERSVFLIPTVSSSETLGILDKLRSFTETYSC